jgi:hypothetical protein
MWMKERQECSLVEEATLAYFHRMTRAPIVEPIWHAQARAVEQ